MPSLPFLRGRNFRFALKLRNGEQAPCAVREMRLTLRRTDRVLEIDCFVERPDFWAQLREVGLASVVVRVDVLDGSIYEDEILAAEDDRDGATLVVGDRLEPALVKIRVADGSRP